MNRFIAFALSLVVNAASFGGLHWSSSVAQQAPRGEVQITELASPSAAAYARLSHGGAG